MSSLLSKRIFTGSIRISLPNPTIRVLSDPSPIREQYIFLTISKLYSFDSVLLDPLNRPIREYALLLSVREDAFYRAVGETIN